MGEDYREWTELNDYTKSGAVHVRGAATTPRTARYTCRLPLGLATNSNQHIFFFCPGSSIYTNALFLLRIWDSYLFYSTQCRDIVFCTHSVSYIFWSFKDSYYIAHERQCVPRLRTAWDKVVTTNDTLMGGQVTRVQSTSRSLL